MLPRVGGHARRSAALPLAARFHFPPAQVTQGLPGPRAPGDDVGPRPEVAVGQAARAGRIPAGGTWKRPALPGASRGCTRCPEPPRGAAAGALL